MPAAWPRPRSSPCRRRRASPCLWRRPERMGSPRPSRSGSSSRRRVPSSRASSGNASAYAASRWFHSASARSPRGSAARKRSSAAAGTRNDGSTGQAELLLGLRDVGRAERRAVRLERVLHRRAEAEVGSHQDQRRSRGLAARSGQRRVDRVDVVAVGDPDRLPAIGLEAPGAIFRERDVGAGGERHRVVVVEADQLAETRDGRRAMPLPTRRLPSGRRRWR